MSKPIPNMPQTRMRFTVSGAASRYGSTNGAAISATAVTDSTTNGRWLLPRPVRVHSRPFMPSSPCGRSMSTRVIAANSMT